MVNLVENGRSTVFMKILIRRETEIDQWVYINDQAGPSHPTSQIAVA